MGLILAIVLINEIAWMGTEVSYNDEWIELYNTTENNINLDGWALKAEDGTPGINLTGTIPVKGFYLLERTDDETVPGISADLIYKGALGNNGENLKLHDNLGNLIDEVNFKDGWPAGDNKTKQTMERIDNNWQNSQNPGGTPKAENSKAIEVRPPQIEALKPADVRPPLTYPVGIVFNEILPSPEGPDETEEWIEIFNQNNFEINISGWKIKDKEGKNNIYIIPDGTKVSPLGFLVLSRPETKITLNNSGDGLNLFYPNEEIADSVDFEKAVLGQSYNRNGNSWSWSSKLTPGKENIIFSQIPSTPSVTSTKAKPAENGSSQASQGAEFVGALPQYLSKKNYSILIIASALAILSAVIILFLKKIISKNQI